MSRAEVNADEAFLTSTSLCICPVQSVNDVRVGSAIPGPITRQLSDAYCRIVDFDFVGQYLKRLEQAARPRGRSHKLGSSSRLRTSLRTVLSDLTDFE